MKKSLLLLISILLSFGLFGGIALSADAEVPAVVMDLSSKAGMMRSRVERYIYDVDPNESGICEMDSKAGGWRIDYAGYDWKGQYRFMMRFTERGKLPEGYEYVRVTFKAESSSYFSVSLHNNGKPLDSVRLCDASSVTPGEWYTTPVVKMPDGFRGRLNNPTHITVGFESLSEDCVFYIKEVAFFKSPEDAALYYGETYAEQVMYSRMTFSEPSNAQVFFSEDILLYEDKNGVKHYDTGEFVYSEEKDAMQLLYSPTAGENGEAADFFRGNYRFMPYFGTELKATISNSARWVRVEYQAINGKNESDPVRLVLANNGNWKADQFVLEDDVQTTDGAWVMTDPVCISESAMARWLGGYWLTVSFDASSSDAKYYVRNMYFFESEADALSFNGETGGTSSAPVSKDYKILTFSEPTNARVFVSDELPVFEDKNGVKHYDTGLSVYSAEQDAYQLLYSPGVDGNGKIVDYKRGNYRFMPYFSDALISSFDYSYCYARVVYRATNPAGETDPVQLVWRNNGNWDRGIYVLEDDVQNTNGEWVMTDPVALGKSEMDRMRQRWMTLYFDASNEGGEYYIRDIYFFPSMEAAENFSPDRAGASVTLGGTDITEYTIVYGEDTDGDVAKELQSYLRVLTGVAPKLVKDTEPETEYEILIGSTNRDASQVYYAPVTGKFAACEIDVDSFVIKMDGSKLVLASPTYWSQNLAVTTFMENYLGYNWDARPEKIDIPANLDYVLRNSNIFLDPWVTVEESVLEEPIVYTDDFEDEEDEPDYWAEYVTDDRWNVEKQNGNRVYAVDAENLTVSWLHVFERDVDLSFRFRAEDLADNAKMGMYARYTYYSSYVAVGYDMARGAWYVEKREGNMFMPMIVALFEDELEEGEWYDVRVKLIGKTVNVYLNGSEEPIMTSDVVEQDTSGRPALFAQGAKVAFDDIDLTLVSGQGRLQDGVVDLSFGLDENGIPVEEQFMCCGGSFLELEDNSLLFLYPGHQYISDDYGLTWKPTNFVALTNIPSVIRLQSGALLQMYKTKVDGKEVHIARWSDDDGKTWEDRGIISEVDYMGYGTAKGINMNEKLMQMSDGRIFASQNFDGYIPAGKPHDHCIVFVELYYSDDEGKTWTKSETGSYDTTDEANWGESRVWEAADGRLVWATGWNYTKWIWYSFSEDNGVTWSKAVKSDVMMPHASFVTYQDPYAEEMTYYMLFVYNEEGSATKGLSRSRLALARSYDGINWEYLMDVDRWESTVAYEGGSVNHYVNPGIYVTEDYVYVACGRSVEPLETVPSGHHWQNNIARRIDKDKLVAYDVWPNTIPVSEK